MTISDIERIAPVSRAIASSLKACLDEDWDDPEEIAHFIANQLNPVADPDNPFRWRITLLTIDGSDPYDD